MPIAQPAPPAATRHVAIVMDGNGRWATNQGLPRLVGHRKGAERVREIVAACPDLGITHLTLYAFSTENWKRSTAEVLGLMSIFARYIRSEAEKLAEVGVRLTFIGDRLRLEPLGLQKLMARIEARTAKGAALHLTVAINYGGRDEITRALRKIAAAGIAADDITEAVIGAHLDTAHLPDPDLVIRTSGETRTSNFLPWQTAYSEYEFTPVLWPDFTRGDLAEILARYASRERRFGGVIAK
ncbi:MAG: polyprenyl diphosphate synthase [Cypionkella sp.]|nr:polyprenyl diphosphate synthase [Cypionkella sp.]